MRPAQLRLARMLLDMTQSDLATATEVSRATIHRFESGLPVGARQVRQLKLAIEAAGAVIIPDGELIEGVPVYGGIGLRSPKDTAASAQGDAGTVV